MKYFFFLAAISTGAMLSLAGCSNAPDHAVLIEQRQAGMREIDAAFGTIHDEVGKPNFNRALVTVQAKTIATLSGRMDEWFQIPDDGVVTETAPRAWTHPEEFRKENEKFATASKNLAAAVGTNDQERLIAAVDALETSCATCHASFRIKSK